VITPSVLFLPSSILARYHIRFIFAYHKSPVSVFRTQQEIQRHDFSHFVENPPSVAQGGKGVVVPGCPMCKKRINTMPQVLDHLADDVLPPLLDRLSSDKSEQHHDPAKLQ
jgi:hypothetical protein